MLTRAGKSVLGLGFGTDIVRTMPRVTSLNVNPCVVTLSRGAAWKMGHPLRLTVRQSVDTIAQLFMSACTITSNSPVVKRLASASEVPGRLWAKQCVFETTITGLMTIETHSSARPTEHLPNASCACTHCIAYILCVAGSPIVAQSGSNKRLSIAKKPLIIVRRQNRSHPAPPSSEFFE
jgi:hypothetical protein